MSRQNFSRKERNFWKHRKTLMEETPARKVYINYPATLRMIEPDGSERRMGAKDIE